MYVCVSSTGNWEALWSICYWSPNRFFRFNREYEQTEIEHNCVRAHARLKRNGQLLMIAYNSALREKERTRERIELPNSAATVRSIYFNWNDWVGWAKRVTPRMNGFERNSKNRERWMNETNDYELRCTWDLLCHYCYCTLVCVCLCVHLLRWFRYSNVDLRKYPSIVNVLISNNNIRRKQQLEDEPEWMQEEAKKSSIHIEPDCKWID